MKATSHLVLKCPSVDARCSNVEPIKRVDAACNANNNSNLGKAQELSDEGFHWWRRVVVTSNHNIWISFVDGGAVLVKDFLVTSRIAEAIKKTDYR